MVAADANDFDGPTASHGDTNTMQMRLTGLLMAFVLVLAACSESTGTPANTPVTTGPTAAGPDTTIATSPGEGGDGVNGEALYNAGCIACHGPNGEGIEGLGKPWAGSEFINGSSDEELLAFLQVGRPVDDPANTTGIAMLPRGGNPALTDADLMDLIAYMRVLNS